MNVIVFISMWRVYIHFLLLLLHIIYIIFKHCNLGLRFKNYMEKVSTIAVFTNERATQLFLFHIIYNFYFMGYAFNTQQPI